MRRARLVKTARGIYEPKITEEMVVRMIMEGLALYRIQAYRVRERIPGKWKLSTPGISDLIGWIKRPGRDTTAFFCEVKRPGGKRRPAQVRFIEDAKRDGCIAFFAESWEDVERELNQHGVFQFEPRPYSSPLPPGNETVPFVTTPSRDVGSLLSDKTR
jgi:hypothetical protein